MPREVIDDRFIGALHLLALTREGLEQDAERERTAIQAGTINSLLNGNYEGDVTIAELLRLGSDGIGTIQYLDGELIVIDGVAYTARSDGSVEAIPDQTKTPFAVLTRFDACVCAEVEKLDFGSFFAHLDAIAPKRPVIAIRAKGSFKNLHLRSVARQRPPYRPLREVVADQTEWHVDYDEGDLVGFRFPDQVAGVEVPGWHLHFLCKDRRHGGHVISLEVETAQIQVSCCDELHIELSADVKLGRLGEADQDAINAVESR